MEFKKKTPDDYYTTPIIKEFNYYNMNSTNYNTSIYKRNPEKKEN